ncbi:hypothetical protein BK004_01740 [bacterium CG10_46_32]|nr:MAG: hypothetical protein BK004_01740 [bacterium CG10_46_32]PIR56264.1 MAG: hypothetical protein COU73_01770 [Parcubacteria group bacterium CG10_big_fil_rev_8_21_14_0_10_46_32]
MDTKFETTQEHTPMEEELPEETGDGETEAEEDLETFDVKERNLIQLHIFAKLFDKVGGVTEWQNSNEAAHNKNAEILSEFLGTSEAAGILQKDHPELCERLAAVKHMLVSTRPGNPVGPEAARVLEDMIHELEEYSEFTKPEEEEIEQSTRKAA